MANSSLHNNIIARLTAVVMLLSGCLAAVVAEPASLIYTKERPLRIVSDWNFAPYEYSNDRGEPEGYNVEVLKTILDRLEIPHVFMLKEWSQAVEMFNSGEADLMIEPFNNRYKYKQKPFYSRKTVSSYKIKIAYKRGTKPVTMLKQIGKTDKVVLKKYDYAAFIVLHRHEIDRQMLRFKTPKIALHELNSGRYSYFIWGERPLVRMLKELNLSNIELSDIDIPAGDMRFVSHDKILIDELDDQFARLEQSGTVEKMSNKWFHPERKDNDVSPVVLLVIALAAVIVIIIFIANRIMAERIRSHARYAQERNKIMQEALNVSGKCVVRLDLSTPYVRNVYGEHLPPEGMPAQDYLDMIHPDDREKMQRFTDMVISGDCEAEGCAYRWNSGTEDSPQWRVIYNQSITETNKNGTAMHVISTLTDITDELANEKHDSELAAKYSNIFEMSIIGMSLYDSKGYLINANRKMRNMMNFENPMDEFYYNKCLFDSPSTSMLADTDHLEECHFCSRIDIPERKVSEYVEMRVKPIKDEDGNLIYILVTARQIGDERDIYCQRKKNNDRMNSVNRKLARTEEELRYLLNESKMKVWRSSFADRSVAFFKDLREYETKIDFDDFVGNTFGEKEKELARAFIDPPHDDVHPQTLLLPVADFFSGSGEKRWYSINRIPEHDETGRIAGCFGLIRDVTELMEAREKLRSETSRANESEQQKSVFLANMSHEIRTPLNAIVGFCDLLQSIDSPDDRKQFIRIIRNNCNMLLHLINDILIVSTMDTDGLQMTPRDIDFAREFNDVCVTLAQQAADTGVQFIIDNPCDTLPTRLDSERINQVIINFATNAMKHTRQGHIKVGYSQENGGIRIYCEDTGDGIPKEKCADVFRRFVKLNDFVQGTGLGLSICKAIADACGGDIGVDSEPGKGSMFWIWIPCPTG